MKEFMKKAQRAVGIFLVMAAASCAVITLKFALYEPELLSGIFHTIGG